jgi:hypothetical protein
MRFEPVGMISCSSGGVSFSYSSSSSSSIPRIFPSVFENPMDLILGETPRCATSVPLAWLFEDEDDDEYEDELRTSRNSSLPGFPHYRYLRALLERTASDARQKYDQYNTGR